MLSPSAERWLHRVGYVTTTLVIVQAGLSAWILGPVLWRGHRMAQHLREASRTYDGPLTSARNDWAWRLLQRLPSRPDADRFDTVRLTFAPSFAKTWCAVSISAGPGGPVARLALVDVTEGDGDPLRATRLQRETPIPAAAFDSLAAKIDHQMSGWGGSAENMYDGMDVGFELRRGGRVISGESNDTRYENLAFSLRDDLASFAPELARKDGWCNAPPADAKAKGA